MLSLLQQPVRLCDGLARRRLLLENRALAQLCKSRLDPATPPGTTTS